MSIEKLLSASNFHYYPSDASPTVQSSYQQHDSNVTNVLGAVVDTLLWQPETSYLANKVVMSPSMPENTSAMVTSSGKTGNTEPSWGGLGTVVQDGTVTYIMVSHVTQAATESEAVDGTINNKMITPKVLQAALSSAVSKAKKDIMLSVYPVGAIYKSTVSTSPATLFGGAWTQIKDVFLMSAGSTYTAGTTGGEAYHQLTKGEMPQHNHTGSVSISGSTSAVGDHTHTYKHGKAGESGKGYQEGGEEDGTTGGAGAHSHTFSASGSYTTDNSGSNAAHNNLPPFRAVYVWYRTA